MAFGPSTCRRPLVAALLIVALAVAGCSSAEDADVPVAGDAADGDRLHIVATTSILGDIVSNVVGDDADVDVLMAPRVDPHQFEASAAQARLLRDADLVVANGFELEVSLTDVLEAAEADGADVHLLFESVSDPLELGHGDHQRTDDDDGPGDDHGEEHATEDVHDDDHEDDDEHRHGGWDPHVWFDPVRTAEAVRGLGDVLATVDGSRPAQEWTSRADAYADEVLATHEELEGILGVVPDERRKLVTDHESFGYLADRYGFELVGAIIPGGATLAEPTASEFRELAETIREHDIPAIFAETTSPGRLSRALAEETGLDVAVVELHSDSLGEPGSGAETYLELLRVDAQRIADALGG